MQAIGSVVSDINGLVYCRRLSTKLAHEWKLISAKPNVGGNGTMTEGEEEVCDARDDRYNILRGIHHCRRG